MWHILDAESITEAEKAERLDEFSGSETFSIE